MIYQKPIVCCNLFRFIRVRVLIGTYFAKYFKLKSKHKITLRINQYLHTTV